MCTLVNLHNSAHFKHVSWSTAQTKATCKLRKYLQQVPKLVLAFQSLPSIQIVKSQTIEKKLWIGVSLNCLNL